MTLVEFRAWLRGLSEAMDGPPNEKQWARILEEFERVGTGAAEQSPASEAVTPIHRNSMDPVEVASFADVPQGPDDDPNGEARYV